MDGDKCMWLSRSDFPFYCHFKVMCYMLHMSVITVRCYPWQKLARPRFHKMGFPVYVCKSTNVRSLKRNQNPHLVRRETVVHSPAACWWSLALSLSPSHSLVSRPCHWQNPDQQQLGYLLCLLLLSRWSDAESNNIVWDKLHIVFSFNVLKKKKNLHSLFLPEAFFLLHWALQQSHSFILNHHCDEITEPYLVIFSLQMSILHDY